MRAGQDKAAPARENAHRGRRAAVWEKCAYLQRRCKTAGKFVSGLGGVKGEESALRPALSDGRGGSVWLMPDGLGCGALISRGRTFSP